MATLPETAPSFATLLRAEKDNPTCSPLVCCGEEGCDRSRDAVACAGCEGCVVEEGKWLQSTEPVLKSFDKAQHKVDDSEMCSALCAMYGGTAWQWNGTTCIVSKTNDVQYMNADEATASYTVSGSRCAGDVAGAYRTQAQKGKASLFMSTAGDAAAEVTDAALSSPPPISAGE